MKSLLKDKTVLRALIFTELMILVTSIHHVYRLGLEPLIPAVALFTVPLLLMWWHSRGRDRLSSWVYAGYVGIVFFYFGIVDGFLDHVAKAVGLNNMTFLPGSDADVIETVYHLWSPEAGSIFYEATGIMTFVWGLAAMFFVFRFVRRTAIQSPATRNGVTEARA